MMMGGGWLVGLLVLLLFLLLVGGLIAGAVLLLRPGSGLNPGGPPGLRPVREDDPLEILRSRYARGEITREEYERMREDMRR